MKILVTGHKGYIGSKVYQRCIAEGFDVLGIDLKEKHDIVEILEHKKYVEFKPEIIFHLAANPRVQMSVEQPVETAYHNTLGTSAILNYAKKSGTRKVVFSSSSAIYGNGDGPVNPYGLQKLQSELECEFYSRMFGVDTVCLRYFNVYSEDQKVSDVYPTVISAWMQKIRDNKELIIYGDGSHLRDYIHVDDIVECNLFVGLSKNKFNGAIYDVGTGKNYDLNFIKSYIIENIKNVSFINLPSRTTDALSTLANTKSLNDMGWYAKIHFVDGLRKCFDIKNLLGE